MSWTVVLHDAFDPEYEALPGPVQDTIAALSLLLMEYGPALGRPHVDKLSGSRHANMKELRFRAEDREYGGSPSPSIRSGKPSS
ncbi:type II toxin-antitoxin system RelE/ParE family toxin [Methylobacterium sp. Leaf91]|uniref:type II toxin-antitoxin system RelE/ParE family toxin n=1 Tax=Methylobacterium sp. Leaf91 TaxID=1736247 RepID=UPI000B0CFEB8